jgi:hypothetical protein
MFFRNNKAFIDFVLHMKTSWSLPLSSPSIWKLTTNQNKLRLASLGTDGLDWKRAFWACFRENDHFHAQNCIYKFGHRIQRFWWIRIWIQAVAESGLIESKFDIQKSSYMSKTKGSRRKPPSPTKTSSNMKFINFFLLLGQFWPIWIGIYPDPGLKHWV